MSGHDPFPALLGVYSLRKLSEIGSGSTLVDHKNVTYWYVRQLSDTRLEVQPLTDQGVPSGILKSVDVKDFIKSYTPEPLYYTDHRVPLVAGLARKILDGDDTVSLGSLDVKEFSALKALLVDQVDFPAHSDPGYDLAHKRVMASIKKILGLLMCRCEMSRDEHRNRFNSFGVSLRKDGHLDESIGFFSKALELEKNDENIYFNMARVYFDKGDLESCTRVLEQALILNPDFKEAGQFVRYVGKRDFSRR
ncbi:MAG: tetratricopeptide repeat protein [Desulfovibrio sp.]|jgi:tetratricopeptide (TPR) repeat protein|nr:tetratricopeptide repeat protein [Desulfovibrio sp.]MBI4958576.1 tetratricopeptide repeat protein [Desulfovibrio sp.]